MDPGVHHHAQPAIHHKYGIVTQSQNVQEQEENGALLNMVELDGVQTLVLDANHHKYGTVMMNQVVPL